MNKGVVIRSTGSWYLVRTPNGDIKDCRIGGKFRLQGMQLTNPVAVGDEVEFETGAEGKGQIKKILPRKNYVVRQSPRRKHALHLLASNIDLAILITTLKQPNLKQGFIDRFLLMTEPYNIPTAIVFNKSDIYREEEQELFDYFKVLYEAIGYKVLLVSAVEKTGIEEFIHLIKDKVSMIAGQSGVGKSSILNCFQPHLELSIGELSDYSGKGQHTTTFAEMHELDFGGFIIDTPGIKTLSFNNLEPLDVAHNFREIFHFSPECKFGGSCLHRDEPGCAVKAAVEQGAISDLRYFNYLAILDEIEGQNYWERHTKI